jgi:arylsulfatase A-like enzyme
MLGTPHDPWTPENVPPEYYARFAETEFPLPPNWQQENDTPYGDEWSNLPKSPAKRTEWMRAYYAMTANLDNNVGRLRAAIDEMGLTDDTLFVFTSDHGECFGAHGRMKKNTFYEEAARVPLLMHWPNGGLTGRACDACITNVDLMPTLLGLTGQPVPPEVEGCDLSQVAAGADGPEPPFAFLQNTGACAAWEDGHEWRAVRTKQYTYAMYKVDGTELLFDNLADPYQLHNLAADPAMQAVCDFLGHRMEAKMATLNDTFEVSSYYKEHWVDQNRCITQTATAGPEGEMQS